MSGLDDFFSRLLDFESGIDPSRFDWYRENYEKSVLRYVSVSAPGVLVRDWSSGLHILRPVTVREYFESLGVASLFDADDPGCLRRMQYRSMNAWGFVGYQLGEAILIANGYCQPETVERVLEDDGQVKLASYYLGQLEARSWAGGRREMIARDPDTGELVLATDVNRWRGRFTGLDGVAKFDDLLRPDRQEAVVRRIARANRESVRSQTRASGLAWEDILESSWVVNGKELRCTESGIVAAAHLCGAAATARLLIGGTPSCDELGTSLFDYLGRFAGYDVSAL